MVSGTAEVVSFSDIPRYPSRREQPATPEMDIAQEETLGTAISDAREVSFPNVDKWWIAFAYLFDRRCI